MGAWPGKYVIGLTGNIATGKSVVRKMLEHLGAYGIDADALSHRAISKGAPGYQPVLNTFGRWILGPDEQIDRGKLARLVFPNPEALKTLERIVHPLIRDAIDVLVRRSKQRVIVIEAIKLLEGDLHTYCDSIWVTNASQDVQMLRLMEKRKMSSEAAWERIHAQSAQVDKLAKADVVVENDKSFEETWKQVATAWGLTVPGEGQAAAAPVRKQVAAGQLAVERARPQAADEIAEFITRMTRRQRQLGRNDIMAAFGEKAFLLLTRDEKLMGLLGWQVENLVARVDDVYIDSAVPMAEALRQMTTEVESASSELQCEAALLFLNPDLAQHQQVWKELGYQPRTVKDLGVRAWQDAAMESMSPGTVLLFKQLRKDRVLRPV
ncbi:MAG: dephospho-CoA kinase [Anaerolineales bacterium]|nr:dephospho-CoA kinase [Anaerolineales bacterium]